MSTILLGSAGLIAATLGSFGYVVAANKVMLVGNILSILFSIVRMRKNVK